MTIDEIAKEADKKLDGRCFVNGIYHYRSHDKHSKEAYCAMSDDKCVYFQKKGNHEYCTKRTG